MSSEPLSDVTFLDIFGQSLEVMAALPVSVAVNEYVVPLVASTTVATVAAGATIPTAAATGVFVLVGTTVFLLNGFIKSGEDDFGDYMNKNLSSLGAFAGKLFLVGDSAFSLTVLCNELGKLYALPNLPIGLGASTLGVVAFAIANKTSNLGVPPEKLIGIASIFLGLALGNASMEYCGGALKELLGKSASSLPYWFPTIIAGSTAVLGNTLGQGLKRLGMFSSETKSHQSSNTENIQQPLLKESESESESENRYCC